MGWQTFVAIGVVALVVRVVTHYGFEWVQTRRLTTWTCSSCNFIVRSNRIGVVDHIRQSHLDGFHQNER